MTSPLALPARVGLAGALLVLLQGAGGISLETIASTVLTALIGFLVVRGFTVERRLTDELTKVRVDVAGVNGRLEEIGKRFDTAQAQTRELYGLIGQHGETAKQERHSFRNELTAVVGETELRLTERLDRIEARLLTVEARVAWDGTTERRRAGD